MKYLEYLFIVAGLLALIGMGVSAAIHPSLPVFLAPGVEGVATNLTTPAPVSGLLHAVEFADNLVQTQNATLDMQSFGQLSGNEGDSFTYNVFVAGPGTTLQNGGAEYYDPCASTFTLPADESNAPWNWTCKITVVEINLTCSGGRTQCTVANVDGDFSINGVSVWHGNKMQWSVLQNVWGAGAWYADSTLSSNPANDPFSEANFTAFRR